MAADNEPEDHPWYRSRRPSSRRAVSALALIAALVFTVVQMSDDWSKPVTTILTTTPPAADAGADHLVGQSSRS